MWWIDKLIGAIPRQEHQKPVSAFAVSGIVVSTLSAARIVYSEMAEVQHLSNCRREFRLGVRIFLLKFKYKIARYEIRSGLYTSKEAFDEDVRSLPDHVSDAKRAVTGYIVTQHSTGRIVHREMEEDGQMTSKKLYRRGLRRTAQLERRYSPFFFEVRPGVYGSRRAFDHFTP